MPRKSILIIDDHAMFRSGLRLLLEANIADTDLREAGALREALEAAGDPPDLVLLDLKLPGLNGMDGLAVLRRSWPDVPLVMLSSQDDPDTEHEALARGAAQFVSKARSAEFVVALAKQLLAGCTTHPRSETGTPGLRLTPRQLEVLDLLCAGLSNKLIARRLGLSENTVRWHVQAILDAMGVASRAEAAYEARRLGLVG